MGRLSTIFLCLLLLLPYPAFAETIGIGVSQQEIAGWFVALKPFALMAFWAGTFWFALIGGFKVKILSCCTAIVGFVVLLI